MCPHPSSAAGTVESLSSEGEVVVGLELDGLEIDGLELDGLELDGPNCVSPSSWSARTNSGARLADSDGPRLLRAWATSESLGPPLTPVTAESLTDFPSITRV